LSLRIEEHIPCEFDLRWLKLHRVEVAEGGKEALPV
jgi:hypothetical protein